jgi:(p)ppGpp synthase/HD superfamily hydrolase
MADSLERILKQPKEIAMVKLADRISNLAPPPAHWTHEKISSYRVEGVQIFDALKGKSAFLDARLQYRLQRYPLPDEA